MNRPLLPEWEGLCVPRLSSDVHGEVLKEVIRSRNAPDLCCSFACEGLPCDFCVFDKYLFPTSLRDAEYWERIDRLIESKFFVAHLQL